MRREILRWLILAVVLGITGGGLYYEYQNTRSCVHPIAYSIGSVDARFGISNTSLISISAQATALWNKAGGKTLFVYDPTAKLTINLVYDEREANAKLGQRIATAQVDLDTERTAIDNLQNSFATKQNVYNTEVNSVNARGGATKSEAKSLAEERAVLNALATTISNRVASYNARIKDLNAVVAEYNRSAGRTFEEGEYVRDAKGERINIFVFVGNSQLMRVLAHEFGHALGLDHNDDPKSIMYAKNESGNLAPTATDLSALKTLCAS